MIVGYISDPHVDGYIEFNKMLYYMRKYWSGNYDNIDVLIIAGDISHSNALTHLFLQELSSIFKHIVVVPGNHDMYMISRSSNHKYNSYGYNRIVEMVEMVEDIENVYYLNGDSVTIDGVVFGGAMGWYDGSYELYKNEIHILKSINKGYTEDDHWRGYLNDSRYTGIKSFKKFFDKQYEIMEDVLSSQQIDVMVTHFNPSNLPEHQDPSYINEPGTAYYNFWGDELLEKYKPQFWVYGHTHHRLVFNKFNTTLLHNAVGYPHEMLPGVTKQIQTFEVLK